MLQATSMPKIKLDKRLSLTHGERLCWKLRINRVVKKRGGIVSIMKDDTHTQVDLRFGARPLV